MELKPLELIMIVVAQAETTLPRSGEACILLWWSDDSKRNRVITVKESFLLIMKTSNNSEAE